MPDSTPTGEAGSLSGQVAFISGAGQGVGRATALRLGSLGAQIAVNDIATTRATGVVDELAAAGVDAIAVEADVTDYQQVAAAIEQTHRHFGRFDILVNNAGNVGADPRGWTLEPFWETEPDQWRPFIDVNFVGVLNCCRHALPILIDQGDGGRIITVVSDAARTGEPRLEVYAAAKAAAAGFMRSIAKSVGRHAITANSIALGTMGGPHYDSMDPAELAQRMRPYLIRRPGEADEAAALIAHLAGPEGSWITGQTYPLNGGISTS